MPTDRELLASIERRVYALECVHRATAPAPAQETPSRATTEEGFIFALIAARLKQHGRVYGADTAIANIRSHRFDEQLQQIFARATVVSR
jgi:uncharacterized protein YecE (DUF72 family)